MIMRAKEPRMNVTEPRYPEAKIQLHTRHPLAWISAVRYELRRLGVDIQEIHRFTEEALESPEDREVKEICAAWAAVEIIS